MCEREREGERERERERKRERERERETIRYLHPRTVRATSVLINHSAPNYCDFTL